MSHARTQIRNAVVALVTGLASTADRVYVSRLHPLPKDKVPALRVFVDDETIQRGTIHDPSMLQRVVTIRIDCVSALSEGLDGDLDQMALEVEEAIAADSNLGGLLSSGLIPSGIELDRSGEGEKDVGILTVVFECEYEVNSDDVETTLA